MYSARNRGRGRGRGQTETRPTHFLALPLHNHPILRTRIHTFQHGLLNTSPPITGLDHRIVIDPMRLHLTLGVMALHADDGEMNVRKALDLLTTLRPSIAEILNGSSSVKVRLDTLDIFKANNNGDANVLFVGPTLGTGEDDVRLSNVCNLIHQSFKSAGFITETRPLKLHCTILNTSYRRPRVPFSYPEILSSTPCRSVLLPSPPISDTARAARFGTYDVRSVELWEMGSHGPNNEYVTCGGIDLRTAPDT